MARIVQLIAAFKYEDAGLYGFAARGNLEVQSVPRSWLKEMEKELANLANKAQGVNYYPDNKCMYVFENEEGHIITLSCWDFNCRWVEWSISHEKWIPNNLWIRDQKTYQRQPMVLADLGWVRKREADR